jgi:hypothetical protein
MAQRMLARVNCPSCQNQFQTPIEQILDVREDPNAKMRVLNGLVNLAECPHCGMRGALGLPFLYHDPEKELALIYMPMEAGRDNEERQRAIGQLTSAVMESLPPEQRKGYLLQPQVFLTMENMTKKILQADGVTEEMIEEQKSKAELLERMLSATSDDVLEAMIKANDNIIDATFFYLLNRNLELAQSVDQEAAVQRILKLREKLLELSSEGQAIRERNDLLEELNEEPSRDKLLELLIKAPDEQAREVLITFGRRLIDYPFFQLLTEKIEAADEEDKEDLIAMRREILEIKEQIDEEIQAVYEGKAEFLREVLQSHNPRELLRNNPQEVDDIFINVLLSNIKAAEEAGAQKNAARLQTVWNMIMEMVEESLPPELRLLNRLMAAENDAKIEELLQENQDIVTERLVHSLERAEAEARKEGQVQTADQMAHVMEKVRQVAEEEGVY